MKYEDARLILNYIAKGLIIAGFAFTGINACRYMQGKTLYTLPVLSKISDSSGAVVRTWQKSMGVESQVDDNFFDDIDSTSTLTSKRTSK